MRTRPAVLLAVLLSLPLSARADLTWTYAPESGEAVAVILDGGRRIKAANWQQISFHDGDAEKVLALRDGHWNRSSIGKAEFAPALTSSLSPDADGFHIAVPLYELTKTDSAQTADKKGVVVRFTSRLSPYRLYVRFKDDAKKIPGRISVKKDKAADDFVYKGYQYSGAPSAKLDFLRLQGVEELFKITKAGSEWRYAYKDAGVEPRVAIQPPQGAGPTTPAAPGLAELSADELKLLTEDEKTAYAEALKAARADPAKKADYEKMLAQLKGRVARRQNPELFLSAEDQELLSADDKAKYLKELRDAAWEEAAMKAITAKYRKILYPDDRLADHELKRLTEGEAAEYKKELAAAKTDQPPVVEKVVSAWRGFVKRKKDNREPYWSLFVLSDKALEPYRDQADAIRKQMRAEGDFKKRVELGQRYYCTGLTIKSTIKPKDNDKKTLELLKKLAENPSADLLKEKLDGQAKRAVAPTPDPLCSGGLWNRDHQDELLRDQTPGPGMSMKVGDVPAPTEKKAKPGEWNDVINAGKFGVWAGLLGFFLGGPFGAVALGVVGMAFAFGMSKIK